MLAITISKNSLILGLFALSTAAVLALTHEGTKERVAASERAAAQKALLQLFPEHQHDNDLLMDTVPVPEKYRSTLGTGEEDSIHVARNKNVPIGIIVPTTARDGYSGDIRMIVGINMDGTLAGVRVLDHKETPGLGDKIDLKKSDWVLSFNGKSINLPQKQGWKVKKDGGEFDQFTGATITPRAVVHQVHQVLSFFEQEHTQLPLKVSEPNTSTP
ncbi:electron transport complex subunit RsxG [Marinibactrum halimedae]|uniref:Ion-translocating oxidoreductase complex subunit G n=1 Tax=Marinibactrum halimedae TaxID=1444977 RepID=A0AA37WN00_9GAMM|nr:electron transport complex subunit RsxG [Marinibactrum halimedae]MCD9460358.1 electron transport complex subunit RsxG [Marinibactrum halimedae]GLS26795.1 electron transport complex subunit G [Marinibactrum halimedae]